LPFARRLIQRLALAILAVVGLPTIATASPSHLIQPGMLVWGGDQEGGGPYVYPADDDPSRIVGFEVEIADALARQMGLHASFFQGPWDRMPELLATHKCDVVLNGYEWMPSRLETMDATIPYYVYALQLLARDDGEIRGWADLSGLAAPGARPSRRGTALRRVGVLSGSAAERYLTERFADGVEAVSYDGSTDAMREVETKKLDATLQDTPVAVFYRSRFPHLVPVEAPVARGYYVIYARKGESDLVRDLDRALARLIQNGEMEAIHRKYGLWDDAQSELATIAAASKFYGLGPPPNASPPSGSSDSAGAARETKAPGTPAVPVGPSERKRGLAVVTAYGPTLLRAAGLTVVLSCLSFPLAIAIGLSIAITRLYGPAWTKSALAAYVEFLRGTPLMLQLYFIFFFLPEVGINVPAFWTAILGLSVNYSAYESEIYRAGLVSIPPGQMEAALSLGMSRALALRRIIVPQAARIVLPPIVNDFIALFKDTSICSVVTLVELTKRFSILSQSTQATFELMLMTGFLYLAMSYPLSLVSRVLERRLAGAPA
jgi:polar amino acid transport system substrate-binding protein